MARKPETAVRSLFKRPKVRQLNLPQDEAELRNMLTGRKTAQQLLVQNIETMEAVANTALATGSGNHYADEIRCLAQMVRDAVAQGDAAGAALHAIKLTEAWMQARADAVFAPLVRKQERFLERRDDGQRDRAEQLLRKLVTVKDTAAAMNLSEKQIRNLVPKETRDAILRPNRKS